MASETAPRPPTPTAEGTPVADDALNIGRAVASGIRWKALTQVVSEGSRVVVALILARLLTPGDYGVAGMAMVSVSFASLFTDPALGSALVQRRRINAVPRIQVCSNRNGDCHRPIPRCRLTGHSAPYSRHPAFAPHPDE